MIAPIRFGKTERAAERFSGFQVVYKKENVVELHREGLSKSLGSLKRDAAEA
jgi:hypothetical protein